MVRRSRVALLALGLVLAEPGFAPAGASAAPGDTVRIHAGRGTITDAAGHRWRPAGKRFDGRRTPIARALQLTMSPKLYEVLADGISRAPLRIGRPGRYAVTLYLAESRRSARVRAFRVSAPGVSRFVDVPIGNGLQRPLHAAFETVVRGRSLTLRFRALRGRPVVAAVEAQRLGPVGMPAIAPAFHDGFDGRAGGPPNPATWQVMTGFGWGPSQLQAYTDRPSNVALDGSGQMVIAARREQQIDSRGQPSSYTSGRVESRGAITLERTRVEARVQVPAGAGLWPLFWASGVEPPAWPASGELDIMEFAGGRSQMVYGFVHGPLRHDPAQIYQNGAVMHRPGSFASAAHTYAIRTEPNVVEFYVDGRRYGSVSRADIPRGSPWLLARPYRLVLNVAVGGFGGPVPAATAFPARMTVDDVSIWR